MSVAEAMQSDVKDKQSEALIVTRLQSSDLGVWDSYVESHPEGTFYHLSGWRHVIGAHLRHPVFYLIAKVGTDIHGVLPLARVSSLLFGDALMSLPFLVYGGPLASNRSARDSLLGHAVELAEELGVDYLEIRNRNPVTDWMSKRKYVTFRKVISADPEVNLKEIPRKQRAMVRKGMKMGLADTIDTNAESLYRVLSECKRNLGTPFFSKSYLQAISDQFGDACEILTLRKDNAPVASVMSFRFRNEILPYYGGGVAAARQVYANDYLYWKVMERAALNGVEIFDYGRSQEGTGPYRFKKHWGFEPEPMSYEYHLVRSAEIPQLDPSNSRYQRLIAMWRRLPLPVANLIGPQLARRLG